MFDQHRAGRPSSRRPMLPNLRTGRAVSTAAVDPATPSGSVRAGISGQSEGFDFGAPTEPLSAGGGFAETSAACSRSGCSPRQASARMKKVAQVLLSISPAFGSQDSGDEATATSHGGNQEDTSYRLDEAAIDSMHRIRLAQT
ncbi:hypothetical protein [Nannocystis pusilla]|uniref:hypothetical protein n=1 Tax=Nannocystis pusilla TaxID=889268 RepID=UPI003B807492